MNSRKSGWTLITKTQQNAPIPSSTLARFVIKVQTVLREFKMLFRDEMQWNYLPM